MIVSLLRKFRLLVFALVLIGIVTSILEAIGLSLFVPILEGLKFGGGFSYPFPFDRMTEMFVGLGLAERMRIVAGMLIVITALKGSALYVNGILGAKLEVVVTNLKQMQSYRRFLDMEIGFFNSRKGAHLYTLIVSYSGQFGNVARMIAAIGPAMFTFIVLLAMLFMISWKMTLVAGGFAILSSLVLQKLQKKAAAAGSEIARANKRLNSTVLDVIAGMKIIRLFDRSADMINRFANDQKNWGKRLIGVAKIQAATRPVFEMTSMSGLAILLLVGSFLFFSSGTSSVSVDMLLIFLMVFYRLLPPVAALNQTRVGISVAWPSLLEINDFLCETASQRIKDGTKDFSKLSNAIEFNNVSFTYRSENELVLKDLSFVIPSGQRIGVVGPSGSGKSTFIDLILRFYDPHKGNILVDGIDLRELKLGSWRQRIGVVDQTTFLFNDSVRGNIAYGKPEASIEEVEAAARKAHAHEFVSELPNGYDTMIGDRGVLLSGGQRQRIAIARAIILNPEILIFDEATSALDTESEQIVQQALNEVGEGRTVITIAHRLSTVIDSDIIVVFERGRIVQVGSHRELLANQGVYRKLVQRQSLKEEVLI